MIPERAWVMYGHEYSGTYMHIGSYDYVRGHGLREPIVKIYFLEVALDDDAGTHWGWLATGTDVPTMIWPSLAQFSMCFPYGIASAEKAGKGQRVRLLATPAPREPLDAPLPRPVE